MQAASSHLTTQRHSLTAWTPHYHHSLLRVRGLFRASGCDKMQLQTLLSWSPGDLWDRVSGKLPPDFLTLWRTWKRMTTAWPAAGKHGCRGGAQPLATSGDKGAGRMKSPRAAPHTGGDLRVSWWGPGRGTAATLQASRGPEAQNHLQAPGPNPHPHRSACLPDPALFGFTLVKNSSVVLTPIFLTTNVAEHLPTPRPFLAPLPWSTWAPLHQFIGLFDLFKQTFFFHP